MVYQATKTEEQPRSAILHDSTNKPVTATTTTNPTDDSHRYQFVATGVVANARLTPLLPSDWVDATVHKNRYDAELSKTTVRPPGNDESEPARPRRRKVPEFLWENSPRHETKCLRDDVKVYSHLPNGINILDSKWVLGRLFANDDGETAQTNPLLATCETHCFSGLEGFHAFARSVELLTPPGCDGGDSSELDGASSTDALQATKSERSQQIQELLRNLPDIAKPPNSHPLAAATLDRPPKEILNWWVVKDAGANGAGGVWVVGNENAASFGHPDTSPILPSHKYVAQQYVWPPVLYEGKKAHVRVYVTVTCDGRAFCHKRAFLHIANGEFAIHGDSNNTSSNDSNTDDAFDDCIHITNCCANSHDDTKFAGEILADFGETEYTTWGDNKASEGGSQPVVPLAEFFPSVQATVSAVVQKTFALGLLDGGEKNHGFEYCGMDFMLSYRKSKTGSSTLQPVAYLLEINSPPSQDTASSLPHAEDLHNEVLRDWMTCWVIPHIDPTYPIRAGGWKDCKVDHSDNARSSRTKEGSETDEVLPSKAAMLNKIRWALFERKAQKKAINRMQINRSMRDSKGTQLRNCDGIDNDCDCNDNSDRSAMQISRFARSQFPFFSTRQCPNRRDDSKVATRQGQTHAPIFFENAGGAQVPQAVIDHVTVSLTRRHREKIGSETKAAARETLRRLLVGGTEERTESSSVVILGLNATSLMVSLAQRYARMLTEADEVLISTENHLANFDPWIAAAKASGAKIKLWAPFHNEQRRINRCLKASVEYEIAVSLEDLVTPHTRIVALPHASNVLGSVRPISDLSQMIKDRSRGYAHIVVDGVAVAPHDFVGFDEQFVGNVDWYVVSMHKLFGPHVGVLLARQNPSINEFLESTEELFPDDKTKEERLQALLESGTANIEGCAGIVGLGMYFRSLAIWNDNPDLDPEGCETYAIGSGVKDSTVMVSVREVKLAYDMIRTVEAALLQVLLRRLSRWSLVKILDGSQRTGFPALQEEYRLPTASFVHERIAPREIYEFCLKRGITCRNGYFLCTRFLATDFEFDHNPDGVLRVSLAHYNTPQEVQILCDTLESMPGWFLNNI